MGNLQINLNFKNACIETDAAGFDLDRGRAANLADWLFGNNQAKILKAY